jgi:hypothetical protein
MESGMQILFAHSSRFVRGLLLIVLLAFWAANRLSTPSNKVPESSKRRVIKMVAKPSQSLTIKVKQPEMAVTIS